MTGLGAVMTENDNLGEKFWWSGRWKNEWKMVRSAR
jgi:hypothetical protein